MSRSNHPSQDGRAVDSRDGARTTGEGASTALAAMLKKRRQRVENESEPVPLENPPTPQQGSEA